MAYLRGQRGLFFDAKHINRQSPIFYPLNQCNMKLLLFFAMLLPVTMAAQRIALIDRGFKRPLQFTDSATTEHLVQGYFPVHVEDLGYVLKTTDWFISSIDEGWTHAKVGDHVPSGRSTFLYTEGMVRRTPLHKIILNTRTSAFSTSLKLVQFDDSRKRAIQKLLIFSDYIRNNLAVADEAKKVY